METIIHLCEWIASILLAIGAFVIGFTSHRVASIWFFYAGLVIGLLALALTLQKEVYYEAVEPPKKMESSFASQPQGTAAPIPTINNSINATNAANSGFIGNNAGTVNIANHTENTFNKKPRFSEKVRKIIIAAGGNTVGLPNTDGSRFVFIEFSQNGNIRFGCPEPEATEPDLSRPVVGTVRNGNIYIDAVIYAGEGRLPMRIKNNELIDRPPGWDKNDNDDALEVVDEKGIPVIQLIYSSDTVVTLKGRFVNGKSAVILGEGMAMGPLEKIKDAPIKRLFKYPAALYHGVMADDDANKTILTPDQRAKIVAFLRRNLRVEGVLFITYLSEDKESAQYAAELQQAFFQGGVTSALRGISGEITIPNGITLIKESRAKALLQATLTESGVLFTEGTWKSLAPAKPPEDWALAVGSLDRKQ